VNEGPTGPTPEETPPAPEPTPAPQPAAWEVPAHTPQPAAAEPAPYVPPPDYAAPPGYGAPGYGAPAAAAPRRNMGPIVVAVVVVVVLLVAIIGYVAAGFAVAAGQISSADKTLNTVITNENAITAQFNSSKANSALDTKATAADLQTNKTAVGQLVSQSQAAQPTITSDDASLASAQDSLKNNSWLTALSKSSLDQKSAKIAHWRNALASAKTITTDLVQLGTFLQSYDDALIDVDNLITKGNANDFTGMAAALGSLKTDAAKAISLADAPGLPADMKAFLTDVQAEGQDTTTLLNDAIAGADNTTLQADINKVDADGTKVDAHDIAAINTAITAFYGTLIDAYNSEVSKANAM
jgi:hypothetical protein